MRARAVAEIGTLAWIAVGLAGPSQPRLAFGALAAGAGLVLLALRRLRPGALASPALRRGELLLWNLVLLFWLCEAALRGAFAAGLLPGWLAESPEQARYRLDPRGEWLGTRPNSRGFYDGEFAPQPPPGAVRVVALGDSYSVGMVPYPENYLTLADELLGADVELLNLGVVHMAVRQYLEILLAEGLALRPDAVLVGIYLGNDVQEDPPRGPLADGSRTLATAQRLATALRLRGPGGRVLLADRMYRFEADGTRVERPLMSPEKHREREWKHLRQLFAPPPAGDMLRAWRDTERALDALVAICRARDLPVFVSLAPDEVQVDDALLERVARHYGADPADFDLDYPGRRLAARLSALGVPVLDLTPALRAAQAGGPTYHLRAVHWNARGNAAAARALAPWLREQLAAAGLPE